MQHRRNSFDVKYNDMYYDLKKSNMVSDAIKHHKACLVGNLKRGNRPKSRRSVPMLRPTRVQNSAEDRLRRREVRAYGSWLHPVLPNAEVAHRLHRFPVGHLRFGRADIFEIDYTTLRRKLLWRVVVLDDLLFCLLDSPPADALPQFPEKTNLPGH